MSGVDITGAHEIKNKYICDKCGADLSILGNANVLGRYYSYSRYGSVIKCKRCQSIIQIEYERRYTRNAEQGKGAEKYQQAV